MYDDVEADYWKSIFVHLQHKNMIRINAETLGMHESLSEIEKFNVRHPEIKSEVKNAATYVTWEIFITPTIKLRLFIQNGIKASLMQVSGGDLVKIADAKFHNNPFPEIEEFLERRSTYETELQQAVEQDIKFKKQQKLTGELIKAILKKQFNDSKTIWNIEYTKDGFSINLQNENKERTFSIPLQNYREELLKKLSEF